MRELLEDVTARLIRHELYVARFYLQRDVYEAAVSRILYALKNYGGNADALESKGLEPEALVLLGSTYLKLHRWQDAREAFHHRVAERYATSALSIQARKYLSYMKDGGCERGSPAEDGARHRRRENIRRTLELVLAAEGYKVLGAETASGELRSSRARTRRGPGPSST
jgi:outer membrane protein assembly factor BamD